MKFEQAVPKAALSGSLKDFRSPQGPELLDRTSKFHDWQDLRRQSDLWPYARSTSTAPQSRCEAKSDTGEDFGGINFASQDYLSLSSHPAVKAAAMQAIEKYGVHSAGSAALLGNTTNSLLLSEGLSQFMNGREIVLYPTGWMAGYGSVQGFVRPNDHIVIDILAHSCLQAGAKASTQNIHYHAHLNVEAITRKLKHIRASDTENAILVVTESLFSMHADTPDFGVLRELCDQYNAKLLVDCAHDVGSMGEHGHGLMGEQGMLDAADIIIGSFSKTFASNGGFIAIKSVHAAEYLKYYSATHTFSNALSPVQAATVSKALEIVRSDEGKALRVKLMDNILRLRSEIDMVGLKAMGDPSPIVPVLIGTEAHGRFASHHLSALGGIANLVEYPAVPQGDARFRFQVMASHTRGDIEDVVRILNLAMKAGERDCLRAEESHRAARPAKSSAVTKSETGPQASI